MSNWCGCKQFLLGHTVSEPANCFCRCGGRQYDKSGRGHVHTRQEQKIIIAPNSSDGHLVLQLKLQEPTTATIRIFDSNGAKVYMMKEALWLGEVRKEIDIRPQSSGIYILKLQLGNQTHTIRLVVVR